MLLAENTSKEIGTKAVESIVLDYRAGILLSLNVILRLLTPKIFMKKKRFEVTLRTVETLDI